MLNAKYILVSPIHIHRITKETNLEKEFGKETVTFSKESRQFVVNDMSPDNIFFGTAEYLEGYLNYHLDDIFPVKLPFYILLELENGQYVDYLSREPIASSLVRDEKTPIFYDEFYARPIASEDVIDVLKEYRKLNAEDLDNLKKEFIKFNQRGIIASQYHVNKDYKIKK